MTWTERIISAHTAVTPNVSHAQRLSSDRYFVWQEDGGNDLVANGRHGERIVTGSTDLYTKKELDPWVGALGESLSGYGVAWSLLGCDYEESTGFWHWSWDWEVS